MKSTSKKTKSKRKKLNKKRLSNIKVYSITFDNTWTKMIKAKNKKEAINIFSKYSGKHPSYWDKKYKIELMTHPSWYKDKDWLKTTGIYSGDGSKRHTLS